MKTLACVISSAPYGQRTVRDALDVVMACAAFDMPPALFFIDDGVLTLLKEQSPETIGQKNIASVLTSLPLFDIEFIQVCRDSIVERGIQPKDVVLSPMQFDRAQLPEMLGEYSIVLTF